MAVGNITALEAENRTLTATVVGNTAAINDLTTNSTASMRKIADSNLQMGSFNITFSTGTVNASALINEKRYTQCVVDLNGNGDQTTLQGCLTQVTTGDILVRKGNYKLTSQQDIINDNVNIMCDQGANFYYDGAQYAFNFTGSDKIKFMNCVIRLNGTGSAGGIYMNDTSDSVFDGLWVLNGEHNNNAICYRVTGPSFYNNFYNVYASCNNTGIQFDDWANDNHLFGFSARGTSGGRVMNGLKVLNTHTITCLGCTFENFGNGLFAENSTGVWMTDTYCEQGSIACFNVSKSNADMQFRNYYLSSASGVVGNTSSRAYQRASGPYDVVNTNFCQYWNGTAEIFASPCDR